MVDFIKKGASKNQHVGVVPWSKLISNPQRKVSKKPFFEKKKRLLIISGGKKKDKR
jgi:hypothetical protein